MICCNLQPSYSPVIPYNKLSQSSTLSIDSTVYSTEYSVASSCDTTPYTYTHTYNNSKIADILSTKKYNTPTLESIMPQHNNKSDILQQHTALREFLFTDIGHIFMLNRLVSGSYTQTYSTTEQKSTYRYIAVDTDIHYIHIYDMNAVRGKPIQSIDIATLHNVTRLNNTTLQLVQLLNNKQYTVQLQYNNPYDCELWQLTYTWLLHAYIRAHSNNQKLALNNKQRHINMVYCMELLCDYIELQQLENITQSELNTIQSTVQSATLNSAHMNIDQLKRSIDIIDSKIHKSEDTNRQLLVSGCSQMIELQQKIDALYAQNEVLQQNINALKN